MLRQKDQDHMLALRCDAKGILLEVLADRKGFFAQHAPESLAGVMDNKSTVHFQAMLAEAIRQGLSLRPDIMLKCGEHECFFSMFTLPIADGLLVMAVQKLQHIFKVYEEFMWLINEQNRMLRVEQKKASGQGLGNGKPSQLDELMEVNNDLANMQRELAKKNRELTKAYAKIEAMSRTDPLSGLANRRYFTERLEQAMALSRRLSMPLALAMADLDNFKSVNDNYGHTIGDTVIESFARVIKQNCRAEDLPTRYGGEEFVILMPGNTAQNGCALAERIRVAMSEQDVLGDGKRVTVSIGVAQLEPEDTAEKFIARADEALYLAKANGRNRVEGCFLATEIQSV